MAYDKIFLNDVGHVFTISTHFDLTGVNTATLEIQKPSDTGSSTWVASITNAESGTLVYITQSGDINIAGTYEGNAYAWISDTNKVHGDTFNFEVFDIWQ